MPEVKLPPPEPQTNTIKTDIELFAKAYFNIELTAYQKQLITALLNNATKFRSKHDIQRDAERVLRAYVTEGLKPGGRVRLPQHYLPPRLAKMKGVTQEGKVLALIKRAEGAYNFELSRIALKYTSVISSLRKDGHNIPPPERQYLKNGRASNTYLYRLADND